MKTIMLYAASLWVIVVVALYALLMGISVCMAIHEWFAYILFLISYVFVYAIVIPYEERFLAGRFKENYLDYKAHTGRLFPTRRGYQSKIAVVPDYKAGILGEVHVVIIVIILFALIYFYFVK